MHISWTISYGPRTLKISNRKWILQLLCGRNRRWAYSGNFLTLTLLNYHIEQIKRSTSYGDEIAWAALWLYWATDDDQYLTVADDFISEFNLDDVNSSPTGNLNSRRGFIIELNRGTII